MKPSVAKSLYVGRKSSMKRRYTASGSVLLSTTCEPRSCPVMASQFCLSPLTHAEVKFGLFELNVDEYRTVDLDLSNFHGQT